MFSKRTGWALAHNRFTLAQRQVREQGAAIHDLTVSNPARAKLSFDTEAILDSLRNPDVMDYDPQPKGLLNAREAVADYYRQAHHAVVDPESLLLTASTSEGYAYVLRLLCNPGDEVLVPKPSYPLFEFLADLQDVTLVPYPLIYDHGWQIDFHSLSRAVSKLTRAVVIVHPNNPTGSFTSPVERDALNQFCRERDLALIADEVFLDYAFDGNRRQSFVSNQDTLTFTLSGLSKISGLPQMKLAWIVANGPAAEVAAALNRLEIIADTFLSVSTPIQLAGWQLLQQRRIIQPQLMDRVRTNLKELDRHLEKRRLCARLAVEGGWYVVLRVPATRSDEDVAIDLLREAHVLVHPGHFFDFTGDGHLILSLIAPEADFSEGIRSLLMFFG